MTPVAGTPFSLLPPPVARPADIPDQTLVQLEWAAVLDVVAGFAAGPLGAARVRARRPSSHVAEVRAALGAVAELSDLLRHNDPFRAEPVPDLTAQLALLAISGGVLDGPAFSELTRALRAMRVTATELRRVAEAAPGAGALVVEIPPRDLERDLERAIAADGSVQDEASHALRRARAGMRDLRSHLVRTLEDLLRRLGASERAPDATVTLRGGRYVVPVRRDARTRVPGIVHGESASGTTIFVEPEAAVEIANQLAAAEAEEAREVQRVLRELSERARQHREAIGAGWDMCIAVDDLYARARYMAATDASLPDMRDAPAPLMVRAGRHPLLLASGRPVVPFDLTLEPERPVLVISGPNTGGKTVLLKAVGLFAGLAQSGIVPPVGEGSVLPVFGAAFADIGDHQSIAESLSTFSARVGALRDILLHADARSLVLLDEVGGGTDPTEGAALAGACVLELGQRRAVALVTTHLSALKELAARAPELQNGSLEFDGASLTPTFRLIQGTPGRSYGLVVARRLGLPEPLLARADALVPEANRALDAALAEVETRSRELEARAAAMEAEAARLHAVREGVAAARGALEERHADIQQQQRELERSGREQARRFLLEARRRVDEALALARAAVSEATAREARRLVEEGVQREAEALKKLDDAARAKGWRVASGREASRKTGAESVAASRAVKRRAQTVSETAAASAFEVDLRGMTGEEAEAALALAIDRAVMEDLPHLRVIHGKGTGALRTRVQQLARRDPRVAAFRLGVVEEGGTGVTILELER
ncbi:MAG: Smr/MutS family protein [Gemmatimonadetes bacterium]|nr:Smr/MutS family protein [Gemmatimonadota bacterium]